MKYIILVLLFCLSIKANYAQWTEIPSPISYISSSNFINDDTGFLLTSRGYLERTHDGGITWDSIGTKYFFSWLNTSTFLNDSVGYVGGGANFPFPPSSISDLILKTTDGGLSFDSLFGTFSGSDIQTQSFADEDHGMFMGGFKNYKTSDGGQTIDTLILPGGINTNMFASDLAYVNTQNVFVVAHQYISASAKLVRFLFSSNDQGNTWNQLYTDSSENMYSKLQFLNDQEGFLSNGGGLLATTDGGTTWQTLLISPSFNIQQFQFVNTNTGFLNALYGDSSYLYTTLDGGQNWQIELIDTNFYASSLSITDNLIYVSDFNKIYKRDLDSISVGMRTPYNTPSLKLFPNPSHGIIQINFEHNIETNYQIIDNLGQVLQKGKIKEKITRLDLAHYTSGIYTLVISDKSKPLRFSRIFLK